MIGTMMSQPLLISSLIRHAAQYHGDTEIVSIEEDGSVVRSDWAGIARGALRLASALTKAGIEFGDRCATIAWNNQRHLEAYFGLASAGFICHTINPRLFGEQISYIINHAEDRVLFVDMSFLPVVAEIRDELTTLERIFLMGARNEEALEILPEIEFYDELLETADNDYYWPAFDENAPSSMCYTSGTTGHPKGVVYQHRTTVIHAIAAAAPDSLSMSARDVLLPVVPMFHANAWATPYTGAMVGAKIVLPGPFLDGKSIVKLIEQEKVTMAFAVPTIWQMVLNEAGETGTRMASLKRTLTGGTACPQWIIDDFREKYDVDTVHAWGMTETSPIGTINHLLGKHAALPQAERNSIRLNQGRPPYGVQLRIVDDEDNALPNDGEAQGALQIRGMWIVERYHKTDANCTTDDGWFDTGDIASIDPNGYMTIRDRAKDIIKSGGEWISSVELEAIATELPAVEDAAVIGARHPKWDERPVLIVAKAKDLETTEEEILSGFDGKIAKWQIPDKVIFVDEIPRNLTGKVMKPTLREQFGGVLEAESQ